VAQSYAPVGILLRPVELTLKKMGIVTASALCSVNLWTGAPLLAVWIGSKVQGNLNNISMTALFSVVLILALTVFALGYLLTWLNMKYDEITGRPPAARRTSPWMRSMRDERVEDVQKKYGISGVERVVVIVAVVGCLAFEAWFFFFAGSSLPNA
jgi:hypothetical protein